MKTVNDIKGVTEVTLTYKTKVNPKDRTKIASSKDAYRLLFDSWNKNTIEYVEEFKLLQMDIQLFDHLIIIPVEVKQCGENKLDLYYYSLVTLL